MVVTQRRFARGAVLARDKRVSFVRPKVADRCTKHESETMEVIELQRFRREQLALALGREANGHRAADAVAAMIMLIAHIALESKNPDATLETVIKALRAGVEAGKK